MITHYRDGEKEQERVRQNTSLPNKRKTHFEPPLNALWGTKLLTQLAIVTEMVNHRFMLFYRNEIRESDSWHNGALL